MPTVAPVSTDLYEVLGVDPSAGGDEIARAFRSRAKQVHPDANDDPQAAYDFNELVAAYSVLSNHRTRREYDHARAPAAGLGAADISGGGIAVGSSPAAAPVSARWTPRRAWTALIVGALCAILGVGAALFTWRLHQQDAQRHNRFDLVIALRRPNGDITFTTSTGRLVTTREPELHGEGNGLGPTVRVRYDPANPTDVIPDGNTIGRDITLGIVALKLIIGGVVFAVLGARRLRAMRSATRGDR